MLVSNTLKYLPAQLLAPLSQFLSIIFWTHLGDDALIGYVTLIAAFQELAMAVFLQWWMLYSMREYGHYKKLDQLDHYWRTCRTIIAVASVIIACSAVINLRLFVDSQAALNVVLIVAAYSGLRAINNFNASIASLNLQFFKYTVLTLSGPFLGLLIGLFFLFRFGSDPIYPLAGYLLGEAIATAYLCARVVWRRFRFGMSAEIWKAALHYGLPMVPSALFSWLILQYPRFYIADTLTLQDAGLFAVGVGLGQRLASLITMIVTPAALPLLFKRAHEQGQAAAAGQLEANLLLLLAVLMPGLVGLYLVAPNLIPLIIAEPFIDSTLRILPWALATGGMYSMLSGYVNHIFFLQKKTRVLMLINFCTGLGVILLSVVFVRSFGLAGGAMASAAALTTAIVATIAWQWRAGHISLPLPAMIKIALSAAAMVAVVRVMGVDGDGVLALLVQIAVGGLTYCLAATVLFAGEARLLFARFRGAA